DLRPALTTTMLKSTRTTSAVMSSPCRISCRVRDSSNSAAKFSIGAELLDAMLEMAVAMGVGSFINQAAVSENPFSRAAGGWSNPFPAPAEALGNGLSLQDYRHKGLSVLRVQPGQAGRSTSKLARVRAGRSGTQCKVPVEHEADSGGDRHAGGIQDHGVARGCQRGNGPFGIAGVTVPDIA